MELILYTIALVYLGIMIPKTIKLYQMYKESVVQVLFPNFFTYAFKVLIRRDVSSSNLIEKKMGEHQIEYGSIRTETGKVVMNTIRVSNKKTNVLFIDASRYKKIIGSDTDQYWKLIDYKDNEHKIMNPTQLLSKPTVKQNLGRNLKVYLVLKENIEVKTKLDTTLLSNVMTCL